LVTKDEALTSRVEVLAFCRWLQLWSKLAFVTYFNANRQLHRPGGPSKWLTTPSV